METWPSGRRHTPAKGADGKPSRGFESLRLRHHAQLYHYISVLWWRRAYLAPTNAPTNTFASSAFRL